MSFRAALFVATTIALATRLSAQSPDPGASYRTVQTAHFRITYTRPLEHLVKTAADRAEEAYELLLEQLATPPHGRIDLLLADNADITNGFAQRIPSNRVVVWVKPPVSELDIQQFRDWLDLVLTHELAHVFQIDTSGKLGLGLRSIFGRLPYTWPIFPNDEMPRWGLEGLAVEFETRGTGSARTHGSFHEMVVRTAVIEHRLDPIDRITGETPIWPGGQRAYIYGSLFMDYLARKYGVGAQARLVQKTASSILPPVLVLNPISRRALGTSFTDDYEAWQRELQTRYRILLDSLRRIGITETQRVTSDGRSALYPRISPDGKLVSYAEENGRDAVRTRVVDVETGRTHWRTRRNGLGPADWLPSGNLLTGQLEVTQRYSILSDVYRFTHNGQRRLTRRARIAEVDVSTSGDRVVAVENEAGRTRVIVLDTLAQKIRELSGFSADTSWSLPRWSPDGQRIAVARWNEGGNYDIVVLDTLGAVNIEITHDEAIDGAPTWSPDGRYVLFWSDRSGIPNLYAFDTQARALLQVTNVATGAFHPDVAPDGKWIVFAGYHAVGYYIERIPYNPATWQPYTAPPVRASQQRPREALDAAANLHVPATVTPEHGYSFWHTFRPYYWQPFFEDQGTEGKFVGLSSAGVDLVGRHSYGLTIGFDPGNGNSSGFVSYSYTGLRNPTIGAQITRDWDDLGRVRLIRNNGADTTLVNAVEREDVAALTTTFVRRRFRNSTTFAVGGELVNRYRTVLNAPGARFTDAHDRLYGATGRVTFANYRTPALSISREDGVLLQVTGRWRVEPDTVQRDRGYRELTTYNAFYKAFPLHSFAHHVVAARVSAAVRDGAGASLLEVGGTPGSAYSIGPAVFGLAGGFLPVRGFDEGDRVGTRAWSASAEYRLPLAQPARGHKLWPFFLDRTYLAAFADAGNARCDAEARARFLSCTTQSAKPLTSVGAELGADVAAFAFSNTRVRLGVAQPISGPHLRTSAYLTFGAAF